MNRALWDFELGSGQMQIYNSVLRLSSSGPSFPLVYTAVNPFPSDNRFRLVADLQYLTAATRGAGVTLGTLPATFDPNQDRAALQLGRQLGIWQDGDAWQIVFGPAGEEVYALPAPQLDKMTLQIDFAGDVYAVKLDGRPVYTSPPVATRLRIYGWAVRCKPATPAVGAPWKSAKLPSKRCPMMSP